MKTAEVAAIYEVGQRVILTIQDKDIEAEVVSVSTAYPRLAPRLYSVVIQTGPSIIGLSSLPIDGVGMRPAD